MYGHVQIVPKHVVVNRLACAMERTVPTGAMRTVRNGSVIIPNALVVLAVIQMALAKVIGAMLATAIPTATKAHVKMRQRVQVSIKTIRTIYIILMRHAMSVAMVKTCAALKQQR